MPLSIERKEELIERNRQAFGKVQSFLRKDPRPFEVEEIAKELKLTSEAVRHAIANLGKNLVITGEGVATIKDKRKEYYYWKRKGD